MRIDGTARSLSADGKRQGKRISAALLERLDGLIAQLGDARAAVITGQGSAFCAGLDLPALADLDRQTMRGFIQRFSAVMLRIFELPIPLVAAVNGHAVAGGCVLALQADVRIGADRDARIGLNETSSESACLWRCGTLRWQVPGPSLAPLALEGRLVSPAKPAARTSPRSRPRG